MSQFEAREIGKRIAEARILASLTQEELAEMASFSKRSLQDYETGVTIPYRHMREISRLLGREVEWFLHGKASVPDDRLESLEGVVVDGFAAVNRRLERLEERLPREEPPEAQADEDVP
jgi:transcriptional regulator with XRE-family HTH domain